MSLYQSTDTPTPAAEKGTGVLAEPVPSTPADFPGMLNPDEKFKPKKMPAVRRAGIRKSAEYRGLPPEMAEAYIDQFDKEAALAASVGALWKGLKGGLGALKTKVPGLKPKAPMGRLPGISRQVSPQARQAAVTAGTHTRQKGFQRALGREQTGVEKFMSRPGVSTAMDIAPWVILPTAAEALNLGAPGQLGAFAGAMAAPGLIKGRFRGGMQRATQRWIQGKKFRGASALTPVRA